MDTILLDVLILDLLVDGAPPSQGRQQRQRPQARALGRLPHESPRLTLRSSLLQLALPRNK